MKYLRLVYEVSHFFHNIHEMHDQAQVCEHTLMGPKLDQIGCK